MSDIPSIQTALGGFPDYELLDSGRRCKLERFGTVTVIRGEPKAWWEPVLPSAEWDRAQAVHDEDTGWKLRPGCPREWKLRFGNLVFSPACPTPASIWASSPSNPPTGARSSRRPPPARGC